MNGHLARLPREDLLRLFEIMYQGRKVDEKISWSVKTADGLIPTGGFTGIGEEAVAAGATMALDPKVDWAAMQHRSKPGYFRFGLTPYEDFLNQGCKKESSTGGRDGTVHYACLDRHLIKFISHMGAASATACGVADGLRYLYELKKQDGPLPVSMAFFGDGATQQGIVHEAMNYAATRNLPVIFVIDNNHVSTVTHAEGEYAGNHLFMRALGYGMGWRYVENGNDVVAVYNAAKELVDRAREIARLGPYNKGPAKGEIRAPAILECSTFRWSAHNESFNLQDVDLDEWREWRARDPILLYRQFLLELRKRDAIAKISSRESRAMRLIEDREFTEAEIAAVEQRITTEIEDAYVRAKAASDPTPQEDGLGAIFPPEILVKKERIVEPFNAGLRTSFPAHELKGKITLGQSIQRTLAEVLKENPKVRVFGEDVAGHGRVKGGVYGMTLIALREKGILEEQVFDTPLSEFAIIGSAIGQSLVGITPICEIQYLPFLSVAISQLVDYASTHYYTSRIPIPMILRTHYGAGTAAGHFHGSSSLEAFLFHTPGIKMIDPATPADVAGMLRSAINEKCPVVFKENVWALSRVFGDPYAHEVPIGRPALRREGKDLTIITWGAKTIFDAVLPAVARLEAEGRSIEIIDLRTVQPFDLEFLVDSVKQTHRAIVVFEDIEMGGAGQSVAQSVQEAAFDYLCSPVAAHGAAYTPTPQHPKLEHFFLPSADDVYRRVLRLFRVYR